QGEQPDAVPAVVRVQVTRAAADGPGGPADRAGDREPGGRDHLARPGDQDHHGVTGLAGRGRTALGRTALARTRLTRRFPVALLFRGRTGLAGGLTSRRLVSRAANRRLGGSLVQPAARAGRSVTGTGRHSHKRSENPQPPQASKGCVSLTAKACSGSGASRGSRTAGRARGPGRWSFRPEAGSGAPPG